MDGVVEGRIWASRPKLRRACTVKVLKRPEECWRSKTEYLRNNGTSGSSLTVGLLSFAKGRREIVMKSNWEIITRKVMRYGMEWYGGEA